MVPSSLLIERAFGVYKAGAMPTKTAIQRRRARKTQEQIERFRARKERRHVRNEQPSTESIQGALLQIERALDRREERTFRVLILRIGFDTAGAVLDEVRRSILF